MRLLLIICTFLLLFPSCTTMTFSNIQSAKLVNKGESEFTPSYTALSGYQYNYGLQYAYGLDNKKNIRFRIERLNMGDEFTFFGDEYDFNLDMTYIGGGVKYELKENLSSVYLPLSLTVGDGDDNILTMFEPTYLHTFSSKKDKFFSETSLSVKALIPLDAFSDASMALNIGFGFTTNSSKWVLRPEIGCLYTKDNNNITQSSIGISFYR